MLLYDESSEESDIEETPRTKARNGATTPIVELILSKLSLTMEEWDKQYGIKNTQFIKNGSRLTWDCDNEGLVEMFLVKWKDISYIHSSWEELSRLEQLEGSKIYKKIQKYYNSTQNDYICANGENLYFNDNYIEIERILDAKIQKKNEISSESESETSSVEIQQQQPFESLSEEIYNEIMKNNDFSSYNIIFYIKWKSLPYKDSTWERIQDLSEPEDVIAKYFERKKYNLTKNEKEKHPFNWRPSKDLFKAESVKNEFKNGNELRKYQLEGIQWLVWSWINRRNTILADEMGLGKTIQTIGFINYIYNEYNIEGPFIVIAPLSTIANWKKEIEEWSNLYAIVYHGDVVSKKIIQNYEWKENDDKEGKFKFDILITTPEIAIQDVNLLSKNINWSLMVIDEAQKIKNISSKLRTTLLQYVSDSILLLTGTPIQNDITELYSLLNFVDKQTFEDYDKFADDFGNLKDSVKINELHEILRQYILRRMKSDVETNIKPKQELLIEVELTSEQKKYYRAIYEKNIQLLYMNDKAKIPSMMNIMMELRKCCNHPYLITDVEEKLLKENNIKENDSDFYNKSMELLISTSGKMVLLEKLLPKLQKQNHRVLIFSQMVRVLDIIQDFLNYKNYSFERLDGTINGNLRQNAIDRFTKENSNIFIFLICTKAGGLGINLTAADTVIVFDSDWNPQNDIQAIARCHRIGQTKDVKIYRFITRKTYEAEMFSRANMKLGLDKAILHNIEEGKNKDLLLNKKEIENLLKYGAYHIFEEEKEGISEKESQMFCDSNIDEILEKSCKIITSEDNSNGKDNDSIFSKASFVVNNSDTVDINDPDFWSKYVGINNNNIHNDDDEYYIENEDYENKKSKRNRTNVSLDIYPEDESDLPWTKNERDKIISSLMTNGFGKWKEIQEESNIKRRSVEDITNLCICIIGQWCRAIAAYKKNYTNTGTYLVIKDGPGRSNLAKIEALKAIKILRSTYPILEYINPDIKPITNGYDANYSDYETVNHPQNVPSILREETIWKKYFSVGEKNMLILNQLHYCRVIVDKYNLLSDNNNNSLPFYSPLPIKGWNSKDDKFLLIGISKYGWNCQEKILSDSELTFSCKNDFPKFSNLSKRIKKLVDYEMNHNSQMRINSIMPTSDELFASFGLKGNNNNCYSLITKQWNETEIKRLIFVIESIGLPSSHFVLNEKEEENNVIINYEMTKCIDQALSQANNNNSNISTIELMNKYSIDTYPYGGYEYIRIISKIYTKDSIMIFNKIKDLEIEAKRINDIEQRYVIKQYNIFTIHTAERFLENIESMKILRENILKTDIEEIKKWLYNINEAHVKQIAELPIKWNSQYHDYILLNKINHYGFKNFNMILKLKEFNEVSDNLTENVLSRRGKFLVKLLKKVQPWKSKNNSILLSLEEDFDNEKLHNQFEKFSEENNNNNSQINYPNNNNNNNKEMKSKKRKIEDDWNPELNESSSSDDDDNIDNIESSNRHSNHHNSGGKRGSYTVVCDPSVSKEEAHELAADLLAETHLPITVKGIKILSLGKIDYERPKYHNEKYLWPIGYKSIKTFTSYINPNVRIQYVCEILDGGDDGPLFRVTPEDDKSHTSKHLSPTSAWNEILNMVKNKKVKMGLPKSGTAISGPDYYGYTLEPVCTLIEGLENAEKCNKYIFRYQRINERKGSVGNRKSKRRKISTSKEISEENLKKELRERKSHISYLDYEEFNENANIIDDDDEKIIINIKEKRKLNNKTEEENNKNKKIKIEEEKVEKEFSTFTPEIENNLNENNDEENNKKEIEEVENEENSTTTTSSSHFINEPPKEKKTTKVSKKSKKNSNIPSNQGSILSFIKKD